jgi:hypothetical protein
MHSIRFHHLASAPRGRFRGNFSIFYFKTMDARNYLGGGMGRYRQVEKYQYSAINPS